MKHKFDPQKHHRPFDGAQGRRSIRLKGYDYSSEGAYYVTIVAQGRECLFGEIIDGEMHLSKYGEIIQKWWNEIPVHFLNVELGAFVIMPNHIHGIIYIVTECRGEVLSPRDHPNNNNQNVNIGDTYNQDGGTNDEGMKTKNQGGGQQQGGETPPCYVNQHWDKLWRISNINPQKR